MIGRFNGRDGSISMAGKFFPDVRTPIVLLGKMKIIKYTYKRLHINTTTIPHANGYMNTQTLYCYSIEVQ